MKRIFITFLFLISILCIQNTAVSSTSTQDQLEDEMLASLGEVIFEQVKKSAQNGFQGAIEGMGEMVQLEAYAIAQGAQTFKKLIQEVEQQFSKSFKNLPYKLRAFFFLGLMASNSLACAGGFFLLAPFMTQRLWLVRLSVYITTGFGVINGLALSGFVGSTLLSLSKADNEPLVNRGKAFLEGSFSYFRPCFSTFKSSMGAIERHAQQLIHSIPPEEQVLWINKEDHTNTTHVTNDPLLAQSAYFAGLAVGSFLHLMLMYYLVHDHIDFDGNTDTVSSCLKKLLQLPFIYGVVFSSYRTLYFSYKALAFSFSSQIEITPIKESCENFFVWWFSILPRMRDYMRDYIENSILSEF